jgi:hypothetical protein
MIAVSPRATRDFQFQQLKDRYLIYDKKRLRPMRDWPKSSIKPAQFYEKLTTEFVQSCSSDPEFGEILVHIMTDKRSPPRTEWRDAFRLRLAQGNESCKSLDGLRGRL